MQKQNRNISPVSNMDMFVGIIIRDLRKSKNLTQIELVEEVKRLRKRHGVSGVKVSQATLSLIEKGHKTSRKKQFNLDTLQMIALALGKQLSELLKEAETVPDNEELLKEVQRMQAMMDS